MAKVQKLSMYVCTSFNSPTISTVCVPDCYWWKKIVHLSQCSGTCPRKIWWNRECRFRLLWIASKGSLLMFIANNSVEWLYNIMTSALILLTPQNWLLRSWKAIPHPPYSPDLTLPFSIEQPLGRKIGLVYSSIPNHRISLGV